MIIPLHVVFKKVKQVVGYYFFKMKVLGLALLPLVRSILSPLPCGEGAVASSNLGICIRPDYIEGC